MREHCLAERNDNVRALFVDFFKIIYHEKKFSHYCALCSIQRLYRR